MKKQGFDYILSNKNRTTLYIGVTNNLERRILEHKSGKSKFSSKYNLFDLLCFEQINGIERAIEREKQLKNWNSDWKWDFIKEENPKLVDLAKDWFTEEEIKEFKFKKRGINNDIETKKLLVAKYMSNKKGAVTLNLIQGLFANGITTQ